MAIWTRRDGVEESWRFITPILEAWEGDPAWAPAIYEPGTAGPEAAEALMERDGRRWDDSRHG